MATTVTYKGQTLTTVTNGTKILLTSGKYMEDDVTLVDDSRPVIPISLATAIYIYDDSLYTWMNTAEEQ